MSGLVFVDTNVLVYWRDSTEPAKQARAREWLDLLWREQRGRTSAQVLSEFYNVLTRKAGLGVSREAAWRDVLAMLAWKPHPVDGALVCQARDVQSRHQLNWWDCLVIAAAQAQGCSMLLTEDLQDGADYGGVVARNPFTLGVAEAASTYVAAPKLASRHRGRGRPRGRTNRAATASS